MTALLATKQDLLLVKQDVLLLKQDLQHFDQLNVTCLDALESRLSLKMESVESRLLIKLGALMTILFGVASAVVALFR